MLRILFALGLFMVSAASASHAGEPRLIGTYGDWSSYVYIEDGNKVCYMASQPTKDEGNYTRRGEIFALLTHRPSEGTRNVFSYITGYPYKPGSDATVEIKGKRYVLFTQDDTAWAPDSETDEELSKSIRAGSRMIVKGTSARGTKTTDTFSLRGSSAAHDAITKECRG